ncbi:trypsin-like peptidase domain-containing protein [Kribbella sp. NBC_00709]|uniref:trypsin-like peptidase domain-containing protein n=1 Tax=Kribbella sp. NBC_00709 TaxID=2975972 RepID=UPI002E2AEB44|nr:trypsin-like peptidase domain-containing protein [Kribbella sp. NBC_00709]
MMHPSPLCVAEIRTRWPDGQSRVGSGYLVADGWVLTAAHVVRGATSVRIWINPEAKLTVEAEAVVDTAEVRCADGSVDAALIPISGPGHALPAGCPPAVRGTLDREVTEAVTATALGLPWYKLHEPGDESTGLIRELAAVGGTIIPAADHKLGTLAMSVTGGPDVATHDSVESVWAGMSGSAVWAAGRLIGVVAKHHVHEGAGVLTVSPLGTDAGASWLSDVPNFVTAADVTPESLTELIPATYLGVAAELAPALLTDRTDELACLDDFAAGTDRWWWYSADAFAGKSALTAWWVSNNRHPARAAVVACFLRRASNLDTADYAVRSLALQLGAIAQWSDEEAWRLDLLTGDAAIQTFKKLLARAAARCVAEGRRLVVVVDGLDEYQAFGQIPIADWLPKANTLPAGAALLVTSRAGAPSGIPASHPLHQHVHQLAPSDTAARIFQLAGEEIEQAALSDANGLVHQILGFHAAAEGPLTHSDLAGLIRRQHPQSVVYPDEIRKTWKLHLARTITPAPGSASGYGFAHDQLRANARDQFADRLPDYLGQLHTWALEYAGKDWPTETPEYLLRAYTTMLGSALTADTASAELLDRLYDVVSSPGRWMALFLADGSPVLPDEEIVQTQQTLVAAYHEGLLRQRRLELKLAVLGLSRSPVRESQTYPAAGVAVVWTLLGDGDKALRLAQAILEPDGRAYALGAIATAASAQGNLGLMQRAVHEFRNAETQAGQYRERLQIHLALDLAKADQFTEAERVAERIVNLEKRVKCLADVALLAARAGQAETTRALASQVAEMAVQPDAEGHRPMGVLAEAFAVLGVRDRSASCFTKANELTTSARHAHERKYLEWARQTVKTAGWRSMATIAAVTSDDPRGSLTSDPKVRAWLELPAFSLLDHQAWNMANVAAAIALVRGPAAVGDLADRAVQASAENAETHDEQAEGTGSTPFELVSVLLAAGLDTPVTAALQSSTMGGGWRAVQESIRAQLVRHLAAKGAEREALEHSARLAHLGYGTSRTEIIAAVAVAALGTSRWEEYREYARSSVEAEFGQLVAAERAARLVRARQQIEAHLHDSAEQPLTPSVVTHEPVDFYLATLEELSSSSERDNRPGVVLNLAGALPDHALVDPADTWQLLPGVERLVDEDLKIYGYRWLRAQRFLVETRVALGDSEAARRQAEAMIEPLLAIEVLDSSAIADTVAALHAAGALTDDTIAPLLALVAPDHVDDDHARGAIAVAFAKGSVGGPTELADSAADLVTAPVLVLGRLTETLYKSALEILTSLVEGGHVQPARRVAETLLRQAIRPDVLWVDRATLLGGLLRSKEPTVRDEALRHLTIEDAFIDQVTDLPTELLEALLRTSALTGDRSG